MRPRLLRGWEELFVVLNPRPEEERLRLVLYLPYCRPSILSSECGVVEGECRLWCQTFHLSKPLTSMLTAWAMDSCSTTPQLCDLNRSLTSLGFQLFTYKMEILVPTS